MTQESSWQEIQRRYGEIQDISAAIGLLHWDQQTMMPAGGAANRARQIATLSSIQHARLVDPELSALLDDAGSDDALQAAALKNLKKTIDRSTKIPASLVQAAALAQAEGFNAWHEARTKDDFSIFAGPLERLFDLTRQQIELLKTDELTGYDVLLDQFDPGSRAADLDVMFDRLGGGLTELLGALQGRPHPPEVDDAFDVAAQTALNKALVERVGYDMHRGRLDVSAHPFTIGLSAGDVRLTTRYQETDLLSGLGGTIHEMGHGLYEQGLRADWKDMGLGEAAGFGLHESQSRLWENFIGRSLPFFRFMAPLLREHFPDAAVTPEQLYGGANRVEPSLIRVEADEVTYNLHIIVRYQLERALFNGELTIADLPEAWADAYAARLGVRPPSAKDGVLQDVHWSSGSFAYFPSYTIGNLYAASLGATLEAEIPDLWAKVEAGEFAPILGWLREKVHARGHEVDAPEIIRDAVGDRDHVEDLLAHLWGRQGALYGARRGA